MLRLPARIEAHLEHLSGGSLPAADILVGINLLVSGRYYYGNLLGLTDSSGMASVSRDELELRFAADRAMYPMDYKVELGACDSFIEVFILSAEQIARAREAIAASPVSYDIDEAYQRARNAAFTPTLARVWANLPGEQALMVHLTTSRAQES